MGMLLRPGTRANCSHLVVVEGTAPVQRDGLFTPQVQAPSHAPLLACFPRSHVTLAEMWFKTSQPKLYRPSPRACIDTDGQLLNGPHRAQVLGQSHHDQDRRMGNDITALLN